MEDLRERTDLRDFATIFLVSAAIMVYQISLTRVLSVVAWYHFAFLTISMVMLGLGAPGVWFALARDPIRLLPAFLLAAAVAVPVSVELIVRYGAAMLSSSVVFLILCVLPATLALGGAVCLILMKAEGERVSRMYGFDLLGAGLAALLVIPLMHAVPTPHLAGAMGLLPSLCLLFQKSPLRRAGAVVLAASAAWMIVPDSFQITRSKSYDERLVKPVFEKWTPTARITIFDDSFFFLKRHQAGFTWGRGSRYPKNRHIEQYWLEQDGSAGTPITAFDGDLSKVRHLLYDVTSVGYQLRPPKRAAIIGPGGGRDILSALLAGAKDVDAIELNPHTIDVVTNRFGEISGDIYHAPGVRSIAREGRSHLTHTDRVYDLIQLSLIDSEAASAAGAFALAENNLYTVEAFELYADRLSERGLLSTTRFLSEIPRLAVLSKAALEKIGVRDPRKHVVIVAGELVATVLLSRSPFDAEDLRLVDTICLKRGFARLYPVPDDRKASIPLIVQAMDHGLEPLEARGFNLDPPTDDSPYFFHIVSPFAKADDLSVLVKIETPGVNLASTGVLRQAMVAVSLLALVFFLLPFAARLRRAELVEPLAHVARASLYFAAIGCAFMLWENVLVQRFVLYLGHPSYATTVIIASLLLGMGVGSMAATRLGVAGLQRFGLAVPAVLALLVVLLPSLFHASLGAAWWLRMLFSVSVLLPVGGLLGVFFPLGMLRFGDAAKPWYWALNGVFGVVASVMSLALSMEFGFAAVGILSAGGYLVAWLCILGHSEVGA